MRSLDISDNGLNSEEACEKLYELLIENKVLQELYLRHNKIKADGGKRIIDGLIEN